MNRVPSGRSVPSGESGSVAIVSILARGSGRELLRGSAAPIGFSA